MKWRKPWHGDLAAVSFLAILVIIFFWPVVAGQAWIPHGGGDLVSLLYPMYRFAAQSLQAGQMPLWNPHLYAGVPFIADNQSGLFYPPNLLLFLINPQFSYRAMEMLVLFHFWLAGSGMYWLLRKWRTAVSIDRLPALIGATAFMFSGLFVTHIGNLNLIAVAAWLPLVFWAFQGAITAVSSPQRLKLALLSGFLFGLATLAGHGQMTFMLAAFLGTYALYSTIARRGATPLLVLLLTGIVAIGTAAISLLPALEGVQYTVRGGFDAVQATNYSLPWRGLVGLFAPDFFGRGAVRFWGGWDRVEYGYVGVATLLLAVIGIRRQREQLFFLLGAVLFLLLALGEYAPLYPFLLRVLPVFPFQVPARFVLIVDFCLAALAAYGAQRLCAGEWTKLQQRLLLGVLAVASGLILFWMWWLYGELASGWGEREYQMVRAFFVYGAFAVVGLAAIYGRFRHLLTPFQTTALLLALLAFDLISLGRYTEIEWNNPTLGFDYESPALAFLQGDPGIHRLDIATGEWQPSFPAMVNLYSVRGVFNPLDLADYSVYFGSVGYRGSPLYNLLGVKYVVGGKADPPGDTNFLVPVFADDPRVTVYLNTLALPRVLVLHNSQVVADGDEAFAAIHANGFDPSQTVVLSSTNGVNGRSLSQTPTPAAIEIHQYDLNEAKFRVTTDQPAYFLLSDIYHPHWRASVNGEPTDIMKANYALRAVYLDPGTHDIRFWFRPTIWLAGLGLSLVTWLGLLLFFWRMRVGKRPLAH
ncbi:MAG: YfhO family protein [Chloroflexota bacterium]